MKFKYETDNDSTIKMEVSKYSTLEEVLEEFQRFLRGCGYVIEYNKVLTIVEMDE